ncbi:expressed sequence BB146404, isoform CRA_b [Mus musculus]|nr:expressed sequence BB146404, isoform CRA_b [Mus musculus]
MHGYWLGSICFLSKHLDIVKKGLQRDAHCSLFYLPSFWPLLCLVPVFSSPAYTLNAASWKPEGCCF